MTCLFRKLIHSFYLFQEVFPNEFTSGDGKPGKAILKKMSVGGNPSCCNLEALLEKFFQVFLRFTKIYILMILIK